MPPEPLSVVLGRAPLAPEQAVAIAAQLCAALRDSGKPHLQLGPGSLDVEWDGERPLVTLRAPGGQADSAYLAPEQWAGGAVGAAADVYAVGALLYHLLTGAPPARPPETPNLRALPAPLADVLGAALSVDPAIRPSSPGALFPGLLRAHQTLAAGGMTRSARLVGAAALLMLALGGAALVFFGPGDGVDDLLGKIGSDTEGETGRTLAGPGTETGRTVALSDPDSDPGRTVSADPIDSGRTDGADPIDSGRTDGADPIDSGRTDGADPIDPGRTVSADPSDPGRTDGADPIDSGRTDGADPIDSGRTDGADPIDPGRTVSADPVDSGRTDGADPVDPGRTDGADPVDPGRTDEADPVDPGRTDGADPVDPGRADEADPVDPGRTDGADPVDPGRTDGADPVDPGRTDGADAVDPGRTDRADAVDTGRTETAPPLETGRVDPESIPAQPAPAPAAAQSELAHRHPTGRTVRLLLISGGPVVTEAGARIRVPPFLIEAEPARLQDFAAFLDARLGEGRPIGSLLPDGPQRALLQRHLAEGRELPDEPLSGLPSEADASYQAWAGLRPLDLHQRLRAAAIADLPLDDVRGGRPVR